MDPRLCARGCGFFGNPTTQNLCSKCYMNFLKEEEDKQVKGSLVKIFPPTKNSISPYYIRVPATNPFPCFRALLETNAATATALTGEVNTVNSTIKKNRCHSCNKKIGLLGFACRCGESFCSTHRYPEAHACTFDFKSAGRAALAKENPLCKADKLQNRL